MAIEAIHTPRLGRLRPLATEVSLLVVLFAIYKWGRTLIEGSVAHATSNAHWIWHLERALPFPSEKTVQHFFLQWDHTAFLANLYYVGVHFPGTAAFLIWLYVRHRDHYKRVRTQLVILTAAGLAVHMFFPLSPPRLSGFGMVDTMLTVGPSAYPAQANGIANQYAAMPSLHFGWALLVAIAVIRVSTSKWRWLVALHAPLTLFVIVVTANHYWADCAVATALLAIAMLTVHLATRRNRKPTRPIPPAPTTHEAIPLPTEPAEDRTRELVGAA
ncbi:phosphatase PAP2 family protein [Actinomadura barringtoniae]|uniref:Phosphatase PAP2 family protein n=1 Tax=Actinomadura barringtoniae TaxID=1427535 RepID=A0A939T3Z5_9ACTN|nr:phosphatase PAP2 family protein [Actinomadura barringtoniae]MBO2448823.1 phosphatase PAP2 family protein [Actinomadura barringtoniae]